MKGCGYVPIGWIAKTFMRSILRLIAEKRIKSDAKLVSFLCRKGTFCFKMDYKIRRNKARLIKLLNYNKIIITKKLIS